jgi:hypothetical protein
MGFYRDSMGYEWDIPSGSVKIAIEIAIEILSFPIKNGGYFHSYVSLPEGNLMVIVVFHVLSYT